MRSIEKLPWLAGLESQTEGYISDAVVYFQNLDESDLNRPAESGGWSIAQCLEHLNTYGDYYLPRLQTGLGMLKPSASEMYAGSWLGAQLIRLTDPEKGGMKLKAVNKHQPVGSLPAHQTVAAFIDQQESMLHLLRKSQHADIKSHKIPLSIASWISLPPGDILHFMVVHTHRHMLQAKRNVPQL